MNKELKAFCSKLEIKIIDIYKHRLSMEDAEKLAAEFLHAEIIMSEAITTADLDTRTRKTGLKAIRAAVYLAEVQKNDKKPSDNLLNAIVDTNSDVAEAQDEYDRAEVAKLELERHYDIFHNGHLFARTVAKGSFGG